MTASFKRIALLGGAFDPPHRGHLRLAHLAWEHLQPNELRFVPTSRSPIKNAPMADTEARLGMLRGMLEDTPYIIDSVELSRGRESYTVDTLEALNILEPDAAWILVMGLDQALIFEKWKHPSRILELASIAIAGRPCTCVTEHGPGLPDIFSGRVSNNWNGQPGQVILLPSTELELASATIRKKISAGLAPDGLTEQVLATILRDSLYRQ